MLPTPQEYYTYCGVGFWSPQSQQYYFDIISPHLLIALQP